MALLASSICCWLGGDTEGVGARLGPGAGVGSAAYAGPPSGVTSRTPASTLPTNTARQQISPALPRSRPTSGTTRQTRQRHASAREDHRRPVTEQALVGGDPDARTFDLTPLGLAAQLPGQL